MPPYDKPEFGLPLSGKYTPSRHPLCSPRCQHHGEFTRAGIDVEDHPVWLMRMVCAATPNMHRNATKIHKGDLRLDGHSNNIVNCAFLMTDQLDRSACGHALRRFLLIETLAAHSIRTAFKREQPVLNVRLEFGKDAFKDAFIEAGEVEPSYSPLPAKTPYRDVSGAVRRSLRLQECDVLRPLSSRRPRKTGCRSLRSAVRSSKAI
jgi:hypothetical protein